LKYFSYKISSFFITTNAVVPVEARNSSKLFFLPSVSPLGTILLNNTRDDKKDPLILLSSAVDLIS
jgi:hypothetical protein